MNVVSYFSELHMSQTEMRGCELGAGLSFINCAVRLTGSPPDKLKGEVREKTF